MASYKIVLKEIFINFIMKKIMMEKELRVFSDKVFDQSFDESIRVKTKL